jgi:hypothetical protein
MDNFLNYIQYKNADIFDSEKLSIIHYRIIH